MSEFACDTSVAVPLLLRHHRAHDAVMDVLHGHTLRLAGHAVSETYAVLTRLPGASRLAPDDAVTLLSARFATPVGLPTEAVRNLPRRFADAQLAGGSVYDALVALAAHHANLLLATRDGRARGTYERLGVEVYLVRD